MNDAIKMQISAFVDGELPQNEAELLLRRLCQDGELRQQAAEYLAMGRAMRGERSIAGLGKLRERISTALGDASLEPEIDVAEISGRRFLRPVAGVAIAATVALAALVGLQEVQLGSVPEAEPNAGIETVTEDNTYTVPYDQLIEYQGIHSAASSYFGLDKINSRLVTLQVLDDDVFESEVDEPDDDDNEDEDKEDETEVVSQQQTP